MGTMTFTEIYKKGFEIYENNNTGLGFFLVYNQEESDWDLVPKMQRKFNDLDCDWRFDRPIADIPVGNYACEWEVLENAAASCWNEERRDPAIAEEIEDIEKIMLEKMRG